MPGRKTQKKKKLKLGLRRDKAIPLISGLNREDTSGNILANKSCVMMNAHVSEATLLRLKAELEEERFRIEE